MIFKVQGRGVTPASAQGTENYEQIRVAIHPLSVTCQALFKPWGHMVTKKTQTEPLEPTGQWGCSDDQRPQTGTPSYVDDDEPWPEREGEGQSRGEEHTGQGALSPKWKETSCLYLLAVGCWNHSDV